MGYFITHACKMRFISPMSFDASDFAAREYRPEISPRCRRVNIDIARGRAPLSRHFTSAAKFRDGHGIRTPPAHLQSAPT